MAKDDIQIRFFEKKHDVIVWEDFGHFQQTDVHKGVAISFRTPKYKTRDVEKSVKVNFISEVLCCGIFLFSNEFPFRITVLYPTVQTFR